MPRRCPPAGLFCVFATKPQGSLPIIRADDALLGERKPPTIGVGNEPDYRTTMMPLWMSDEREDDDGNGGSVGTMTRAAPKTKRPSMYKVLMMNDDYTPQEFVVWLLEAIFHKGREDAMQVMLHVHHHGVGICGVYTYEVAETKVAQVLDMARRNEHPLQCTMERE